MCCYSQNRIVNTKRSGDKVVTTKCGKCAECLKERQNDWKLRLIKESEQWNHIYFFTLTYSDDHLPCRLVYNDLYDEPIFEGSYPRVMFKANRLLESGEIHDFFDFATCNLPEIERESAKYHYDCGVYSTVRFKDVQNFIKSLRSAYKYEMGANLEMKYFICSEYGSNPIKTRRPHYHGMLFSDVDYNTLAPYFKSWGDDYGRFEFKELDIVDRESRSKVANYVSKYCAKGEFETRRSDIEDSFADIARFSCSHGIGEDYLTDVLQSEVFGLIPQSLKLDKSLNDCVISQETVAKFFELANITVVPHHQLHIVNPFRGNVVKFMSKDVDYIKSIREEIETLLDNLKVYDGSFAYKMPRYYYNRLFCLRIVEERIVTTNIPALHIHWESLFTDYPYHFVHSQKYIDYETYVVKCTRYVQENFLSNAIAYCARERALSRDRAKFQLYNKGKFEGEDSRLAMLLASCSMGRKLASLENATRKLQDFYNEISFKSDF